MSPDVDSMATRSEYSTALKAVASDYGLKAKLFGASLAPPGLCLFALDFEICIHIVTLVLDVFFDNFIRDVATAHTKVAPRPQVPSPELLAQVRELLHQFVGALPFQHLHQTRNGHPRRHRDEQMDMILRDVSFHDRH